MTIGAQHDASLAALQPDHRAGRVDAERVRQRLDERLIAARTALAEQERQDAIRRCRRTAARRQRVVQIGDLDDASRSTAVTQLSFDVVLERDERRAHDAFDGSELQQALGTMQSVQHAVFSGIDADVCSSAASATSAISCRVRPACATGPTTRSRR
jgi:hypothetical protein